MRLLPFSPFRFRHSQSPSPEAATAEVVVTAVAAAAPPCMVAAEAVATAAVPRFAAAVGIMAAALPFALAAEVTAGAMPFGVAAADMAVALGCEGPECISAADTMLARDLAGARPDQDHMPDAWSGCRVMPDVPRILDALRISDEMRFAAPHSTAVRHDRSIGLRLRAATTAAYPDAR